MTRAYLAVVEDNMPVKTAARKFSVPETTLRDRARGRIHPETLKSGTEPILSLEEESRLVEHLKFMSSVGYGYTRVEVTTLASQYAVQLGKRNKDDPFSLHWYYGFMKRWPSLMLDKPRPLEVFRAKATSQEAVSKYFVELRAVLEKYDLFDKPQFIYNVDEKGLIENHTPPKVVSSSEYRCVAVTTPRSSTTTLIGCGNALGQQIPPYFVFKGQRLRSDILSECTPGTNATTSDSGWSNMEIFSTYLNDHFLKYAQRSDPSQPILLLYDGHRSHVSLPIIDWAISRNIVLMVLPAHTSHVLQPLDVGCFGPLERIYNSMKHTYMREQVTTNIDKNAMCAVACKAYTSALSPRNLMSSFEKCGIFPFDDSVVSAEALRPSTVFITSEENREADDSLFRQKEDALHKIKSAPTLKRKVLSSIVSGKAITEENTVFKIQEHTQKQPVKKRKQQSAQKKKSITSSFNSLCQTKHVWIVSCTRGCRK
ncbi:uncharacterized protein LOC124289604 [Haliotis rubra]|uniref:uncharacterized protein LOC124289604 n=1 Tax=Haliotis rubra TaxID=36100 RepID=UPI001EE4FAC9|nr:uncharacterized protein LOC124289604 [Haliotis rubra]